MTHTVYLSLGTNLGARLANLRRAVRLLAPRVQVTRLSPVYETDPWGHLDQPHFLNQVVEARTDLSPTDLLALGQRIEAELGRVPTFRNGPRSLDIDILFYDDEVIATDDLQVPHPRLAGRSFVLVPLCDLAPGLVHPQLGLSAAQMLAEAGREGVRPYKRLVFGAKTYVMGILNVTPDSFSGDGLLQHGDPLQAALEQAWRFVEAGADILDIGGESTRPSAQPVSAEEELQRILPLVRALAEASPAILSVDTYKAAVAEEALLAGADWINDVWALRADPLLAGVAAEFRAPLILMHNRSKPAHADLQERLGGRYVGRHYADLLGEVKAELLESVEQARQAGVAGEAILLDPGIGFGKTVEQNLELIDRLGDIRALGFPVLLGPSRKSFIGYTLNLPPEQRLEGTAAAVALGIARGADIVRVHDVEFMARVARMTDAIVRR